MWKDISYPLTEKSAHWPGQPPVTFTAANEICCGDQANVTIMRTSVHTATHMDAPRHFIEHDIDITHFPLILSTGTVRVVEVDLPEGHIEKQHILAYEQRVAPIESGDRLVFRTRNSEWDWHNKPFDASYCAIAPSAATLLTERGVEFVGVDYLSVAPFEDGVTTHRILLEARVWVVEGLDLRQIQEGYYNYQCLPILIEGCDAAPCRMLVRSQDK